MASIVLGCDSNSNDSKYQDDVAKGLEDAGYKVEKLPIGPSHFANYDYAKHGKNPKGKIGVYLMAASLVSVTDGYEASPGFDYHYFVIRGDVSKLIKSQNDFDTKSIPKDHHGDCIGKLCEEWQGKTYAEINQIAKDKCRCVYAGNSKEAVDNLLSAISGSPLSSTGNNNNNNSNEEDEEEEWDDKDNFTPHKGNIMQIKPYMEIASISFDKSYDSPSGSGNVELLFKPKDYKYLYKGVAMKLKLRRSCDAEWSATGVEEPNYSESEIFFKEHIPTDELLKELGLPNYRKQRNGGVKIITDSSELNGSSDSSTTGNDSSSSSSSSTSSSSSSSGSSSSSKPVNKANKSKSSSNKSKTLSQSYVNSLSPQQALKLSKQTSVYDTKTIKRLGRRSLGLHW